MIKNFIVLGFLSLLTACATANSSKPIARLVPQPGMAAIVITRSSSNLYVLMAADIDVNGQRVASLSPGETYSGMVAPGPLRLSAGSWKSAGDFHLNFTAQSGKTYRFAVAPRSENVAASLVGGVLGSALEGKGPFSITPM